MLRRLLVLVVLLVSAASAQASGLNQGLAPLPLAELLPQARLAPDALTVAAVTGVEPTARPLRPAEVLAYFKALADASPRARLVEYARSHEGRPLVFLAVSDEATIADLETFRSRHADRLDPRTDTAPEPGDKAVAWMAYGIHGDELSSTDAAAVLAQWLVGGEDDGARELRGKLVVLIDPCENPDGRARYLAQVTSFAHRSANIDQDDLSHRAVWPWGRGNHYLFDLNRDWFSMVHPESRRATTIGTWVPQLLVDSHEMGANASYLFPPPRHPFNPFLPENTDKWERAFSDDQAAALDARGYPYFNGEWNEEFFPGYGSSWASYSGAVGILYEMSRTTGTVVRKRNGTVRTFAEAVEHQLASSVANLSSLAHNSDAVLADMLAGRRAVVRDGAEGDLRAWVFPPDPRHPRRLERLALQLTGQGIEVQRANGGVDGGGLRNARTGDAPDGDLPAGTLLVRLDQPAGALARVILDPHVPMDATFFREEREYLEKSKGSRLYDTTAWSVPLARGVAAYWGGRVPKADWESWSPSTPAGAALPAAGWSYAVLDGDPDAAMGALAGLLQAGVTVRAAAKPFSLGEHSFRRGALMIMREGNPDDVEAVVHGVAAAHGLDLLGFGTANATDGPDLGGSHYGVLVAPRVGVLTGMPVSPTAYGAVWHLLDQELDLRFSALDVGSFRRVDLSRYNVLVFPPVMGGPGLYRQLLGPDGRQRLQRWIEAGGTAIGIAGGAAMLADPEWDLVRTRLRRDAVETYPSPVWSLDAGVARAAGRTSALGLNAAGAESGQDDAAPASPYEVAPLLGPGARPFAAGVAQGTALGGSPVPMDEWLKGTLPPGRKQAEKDDRAAADARLRRFMPQGAMLRTDLDEELWLNYGLGRESTVWLGRSEPLLAAPPVRVGARFADLDRLHLGGLLWPEGAARLAHTAYSTREAVGRGQVVLFAGHPAYRRWMADTERMLVNAILLGPGLGTRWSAPW